MPSNLTITVPRGTTYAITLNVQKNGVPASLTGATIRFTVKATRFDDNFEDSTAIIRKDITTHTSPANGISTILLNPEDTAEIPPKKYYYDVKMEEASGNIYELVKGIFHLTAYPTNRLD